jgi:hypothetical protein
VLWEIFIVFAQTAIPADPGDRPFHHPAARQHRKGGHGRGLDIHRIPAPARGALDNFQGPPTFLFHPIAQPLPPIGHVRPNVLQPIKGLICYGQEPWRYVRIPQIGGMDEDTQQETRRVHEEMALAAVEFFGAVIAVGPPCSVVFTVCASMMAAEGCG